MSRFEIGLSAILVVIGTAAVLELGSPLWAGVETEHGGNVLLLLMGSIFALFGVVVSVITGFRPKSVLAGAGIVYVLWPIGVEAVFGPTDSPVVFVVAAVLWTAIALGVGVVYVGDHYVRSPIAR